MNGRRQLPFERSRNFEHSLARFAFDNKRRWAEHLVHQLLLLEKTGGSRDEQRRTIVDERTAIGERRKFFDAGAVRIGNRRSEHWRARRRGHSLSEIFDEFVRVIRDDEAWIRAELTPADGHGGVQTGSDVRAAL